jgi:hypothetical protein
VTLNDTCEGCYFKAGAYLQSNEQWDSATAYAQVTIYNIAVKHQAAA